MEENKKQEYYLNTTFEIAPSSGDDKRNVVIVNPTTDLCEWITDVNEKGTIIITSKVNPNKVLELWESRDRPKYMDCMDHTKDNYTKCCPAR